MRRRHARCLETKLAALTAERDQLRAEVKSCGELSCDECNARTAALTTERDQLRADNSALRAAQKACEACDEPTAFEVQQLRAALALGQQNCDDAYDDLRAERAAANARAERAEAALAIIAANGGTTHETECGPIACNGSWCAEQARAALDATKEGA